MKFLHCADLHIDSPLRGLSAYEGAPVDALRGATRRAFENVVDLALSERVTAVMIAGDLYDGDRDDFNTAMFLQQQLHRLVGAGVLVFIVNGNHDAANDITRRLRVPDGVHVFGHSAASSVECDEIGLCVHGQSYANRQVSENLAARYPDPVSGLLNVGLLHTSLAGKEGPHARYAPCAESELWAKGYQYWALGHVHERYVARQDDRYIVYPGNVQGRHARELGPKGATIVTYEDGVVSGVKHHNVDVVRWVEVVVDVGAFSSFEGVVDAVVSASNGEALSAACLVAVRVVLVGSGALVPSLLARRDELSAQIRADASADAVFIERIQFRVSTAATDADGADSGEASRAIAELVERSLADPALVDHLLAPVSSLGAKLGAERAALTELGVIGLDQGDAKAILADAHQLLLSELDRSGVLEPGAR